MTTYTQTRIFFVPTWETTQTFFLRIFPTNDGAFSLPGTNIPIALAPNMYANTTVANVRQSIPNIYGWHSIPFVRTYGINHTNQPAGYWVGGSRQDRRLTTYSGGFHFTGELGYVSETHGVAFEIDTFDAPGAKIKQRYGFRFSGTPVALTPQLLPASVPPRITVNINLWVYRVPFEQSYHQVNGIWQFK